MTYLDTHVVAWLFSGRTDLLPPRVLRLLDSDEILISPMVTLELEFLRQTGRATQPAAAVAAGLRSSIGLKICDRPFGSIVEAALKEDWTRDPFDRIIVAQARSAGAALLSKDREIIDRYSGAVWDA